MKKSNNSKILKLINKGVKISNPDSIDIGEEVSTDRISGENVVIYSGCKIFGTSTFIDRGVRLGYEGPVTVKNCQIGQDVQLKGGFFEKAVFLEKSSMGSCSYVREGTILEEYAHAAHTVGLKQTILFPFVTLGSLINFCDCFMAGGTGKKNHSEVGSSYIHFNFTPNQDKATPSLIGDVPHGVMLNNAPIFLGGQGGLVGPSRLSYGNIISAGSIFRKDELRESRLIFEGKSSSGNIPFNFGGYQILKRVVLNNIIYIANLLALREWYLNVRFMFVSENFPQNLLDGLKTVLDLGIVERIRRLKELAMKMPASIEAYIKNSNKKETPLVLQKRQFCERFDNIESILHDFKKHNGDTELRDLFLEKLNSYIKRLGKNYITVIKGLESEDSEKGSQWLIGIVDQCLEQVLNLIPLFRDS